MQKKSLYPAVQSNANFPDIEKGILKFWKENNIFQKSIDIREGGDELEFIFYDGPPFANGLPHYGHLLTGFIKDTYARYQTMKGKKVERRFGWDCHGLPAEMAAEKELGISGRAAITKYGIDKFNNHCRSSVMKYEKLWEEYVTKQARWVDFTNSYKTMDISFMESVLWAFNELYKKGLIYEAMRVMPYSWACETPLSNFETRLDNSYRERADKAVTVSFILKDIPQNVPSGFKEYRILAWTTTPWTLPSNLALAIGSDIEYACVSKGDICYIIGKFALSSYAKELEINIEDQFVIIKGKDLEGLTYYTLFNYFKDHPNSFRIFSGEFVTESDGTGIVHCAPGFGEDDQIICQENGIELVCPVDNSGKYTKEIYDFEGIQVLDANDKVIIKLKEQGNWVKTEQILHNYPHCWRTDTPLIYKAVSSWYVKVTDIRNRMCELNQQINWIPENVKEGLFGKWLENARDWSISRNRFWGTPIPIWRSDDNKYPRIDVYGSVEELEKDFGVKITDLHRPFIDELSRPNPDDPTGKSIMRRVSDVFDCWFESGSMPYGQVHYPFENKTWFEKHFPADFIVEYSAQTRGWFYTLMVLSTALFDRPPFLNCICHGVILDTSGQKLSKRLNNYSDPIEVFEKYGSDALRVVMLSSKVIKGQELLIDKDGKMVFEALRLVIKPIWNAYNFFTLYANVDGIQAVQITHTEGLTKLDLYILTKLKNTIQTIDYGLSEFDTIAPFQAVSSFFELLNNWYIRRSRSRFWKSENDNDKITAYNTLYTCLTLISRAMCPIIPLISEEIYKGLSQNKNDSVHLTDFPDMKFLQIDEQLVSDMDLVLDICNAALFIRNNENIRTRQPLNSITIIIEDLVNFKQFEELIKDEINVKQINYSKNLSNYSTKKLVINFPNLAKRLPLKMKQIIADIKQNKWILEGKNLNVAEEILEPSEFEMILEPNKDIIGAKALSNSSGLIILDLEITNELHNEGIARDIIRFIQQARKEADFNITDRLLVDFDVKENKEILENILKKHKNFIEEQTLTTFHQIDKPHYSTTANIEEKQVIIMLGK